MSMDPDSLLPSTDPNPNQNSEDPYAVLSRDLYDSLMKALQTIWFDAGFTPTDCREASEACVRARRMLGIAERPHESF